MQKQITGWWTRDFGKIVLSNSRNKCIIWIYRWTRWTTPWQLTQFRQVERLQSNCTRINTTCVLTTWIRTRTNDLEPLPTVYIYELTRLQLPSSHDHGLQVPLQTRTITASKIAQSRPPSVSSISLEYGAQDRTVMVSKCLTKLTRSWYRSASLCSLNHDLRVYLQIPMIATSRCISNIGRLWPLTIFRSSLDCYFEAYLEWLASTTCSQSGYNVCRWVSI